MNYIVKYDAYKLSAQSLFDPDVLKELVSREDLCGPCWTMVEQSQADVQRGIFNNLPELMGVKLNEKWPSDDLPVPAVCPLMFCSIS